MDVDSRKIFAILVREHASMLLAFLRASIDDPAAVDDIFQDAMVTAWRRLGDYDDTRPFAPWLRGIAKKLVLAHRRRVARAPWHLGDELLDLLDERMAHVEARPGDEWEDKVAALDDCLSGLPAPMRDCVELHYRDGRSTTEIGERDGSGREAIKKRLQRARAALADCLRRKGVLPPVGAESMP